jgi:hypothetical protein
MKRGSRRSLIGLVSGGCNRSHIGETATGHWTSEGALIKKDAIQDAVQIMCREQEIPER